MEGLSSPSILLPQRPFLLPQRYADNERVLRYLQMRGIDRDVLDMCIASDVLYEDTHHNCCFVGFDETGTPRYAMLRSSDPGHSYVLERRGSFLRIKAPGMQRFVRLRSLGAGYSEEAIQRRILRHRYPEVPPRKKVPHPRKVVFHGDFRVQKRVL